MPTSAGRNRGIHTHKQEPRAALEDYPGKMSGNTLLVHPTSLQEPNRNGAVQLPPGLPHANKKPENVPALMATVSFLFLSTGSVLSDREQKEKQQQM